MKKILFFVILLSAIAVTSCEKQDSLPISENSEVTKAGLKCYGCGSYGCDAYPTLLCATCATEGCTNPTHDLPAPPDDILISIYPTSKNMGSNGGTFSISGYKQVTGASTSANWITLKTTMYGVDVVVKENTLGSRNAVITVDMKCVSRSFHVSQSSAPRCINCHSYDCDGCCPNCGSEYCDGCDVCTIPGCNDYTHDHPYPGNQNR